MGCPLLLHLGSIFCSTIWSFSFSASDSRIQSLTSSVWISARSPQHIGTLRQERIFLGTLFLPRCICANNHDNWVSGVVHNSLYQTSWIGYGNFSWTPTRLGPFLVIVWSNLCTYIHKSLRGNISPWWHIRKNSKRVWHKIVRIPPRPSTHSKFPTSPWHGWWL